MPRCACCATDAAGSARSTRSPAAELPARSPRRALLARAGALTAGAALAGCENTTTPVAVGGARGGKGLLGDTSAGGPVDASAIPLARRDYAVTLPTFTDPVRAAAKPERGGELRIYNYSDYL